MNEIKKLAIISGDGYLPRHVYDACKKKKIDCEVIAIEEEADKDIFSDVQHHSFPVYKISKIIKKMKELGVTHVTLAGKVKRAEITRLLLDIKGAKLFAKIIKAGLADNSILQTILKFLEGEGFSIVAPEKIANEIILPKGALGKVKPNKTALDDIKKGVKILKGVASFDVGQALVIQNGLVLGVEAAEGTDELLKRCGEIKQDGEGPILIKILKPFQDKRVDLPCIGKTTIEKAHKYGIAGIVCEAGQTLLLEQEEALALANKHKIFIYGI